jgi:Tfp pilus assembly protein PilF
VRGWLGLIAAAVVATVAVLAGRGLLHRAGSAVDIAPEAALLNNRGLEAMKQDSLDAARRYFEASLEQSARNAPALINIGMIFLRQGDDEHAALHFNQVLAQGLGTTEERAAALYNLAEINMRAGAWSSAADELRQSIALDNRSGNAANNLGYALIMGGRLVEARAELDSAITRFPGFGSLHKNAGLAAFRAGDHGAALKSLDRALELDPGLAAARGLRARVRAAGGDRTGARADWEAYVKLGPADAERAEVENALREQAVLPPR